MLTSKHQLRKTILTQLSAMDPQQATTWSQQACKRLGRLEVFQQSRRVFIYVSFRHEVQTHDLIRDLLDGDKTVTVPRVTDSKTMQPVAITHWNQLAPDRHGIFAPVNGQPDRQPPDVCVVPGVAFTIGGDRLGYGSGYYDRFLAGHRNLATIGLAFECQVVDPIPTQPHDRPVNILVTPTRTVYTNR